MPYSKYFAHFKDIQSAERISDALIDRVLVADYHKLSQFERLDIRHIVLPAHSRLGAPRAESLREEFIFILSGQVDLWVDGWIYQLDSRDAVGFLGGTGRSHTVLNNSDQDVQILVVQERSKKGNQSFFPLNKSYEDEMGPFWWANASELDIGPHDAEPHVIRAVEIARGAGAAGAGGHADGGGGSSGSFQPTFIIKNSELKLDSGFHYPGDTETFDKGLRLSSKLGLKTLGVWFLESLPGKRSCFPHAHTHEEEFTYVVAGNPTVWLNGFAYPLKTGLGVAFLPNTNIAHCMINDSSESTFTLCFGEATEFQDEKLFYPLSPFRNHQGEQLGWLWKNRPEPELGPHSGRPKNASETILSFKVVNIEDAALVLTVFQKSPRYFESVDGQTPTLATAKYYINEKPAKVSEKYLKEFLLIEQDGQPIGAIELHLNHPEPGVAYIALLLITECNFGKYLGKRCYELVEDYCRRHHGTKKIRLGISQDNDVTGFWKKMGFMGNGNSYVWKGEYKTSQVKEYEKAFFDSMVIGC